MSAEFSTQQPTVDNYFKFMLKQFEKDDDFSRLMLVPSTVEEFKTDLVSHLQSCPPDGLPGRSASSAVCSPQIARESVFHPRRLDSHREELSQLAHLKPDDDLARIFDPTRTLHPDMFTHPRETCDYDLFREKLPHEFLDLPGDSGMSFDTDWNMSLWGSPITASDHSTDSIVAQKRVPVADLRSSDVDMDLSDKDMQRVSWPTAKDLEIASESDRLALAYKGPYVVGLLGRLYPSALRDLDDLFCRGAALPWDGNAKTPPLTDENSGDSRNSSAPPPSDDDSDYSGFVYTNNSPPLYPNIVSIDRASPGSAWTLSSLSSPPDTQSGWSTGASDGDVDTDSIASFSSSPLRSIKRRIRESDAPWPVKKARVAATPGAAVFPPTSARSARTATPKDVHAMKIPGTGAPLVRVAPEILPAAALAPLVTLEIPLITTGGGPTLDTDRNASPVNRPSAGSSRPVVAPAPQDNATAGPSNRKFPCPMSGCRQLCASAGDLQRHLESRAHQAPSYKCLACNKAYTRIDALKRHHGNAPACKREHQTLFAAH